MRVRLLVKIAVPVLAFGLTFSILLLRQHNAGEAEVIPVVASAAAGDPAGRAVAPSGDPVSYGQPLAGSSPPQAPPQTTDSAASNRLDPELPVKLLVRPAQEQFSQLATLLNVSADTLNVRVSAVNPQTHMRSVIDVTLLPHERKNLLAAGLTVSSGDDVTVESPSYRDLVARAP